VHTRNCSIKIHKQKRVDELAQLGLLYGSMKVESFEYQQAYLLGRQREISSHLSRLGIASRLVATRDAVGANILQSWAPLNRLFVPHLAVRNADHAASMLSLAAITFGPQEQQALSHIDVGMLSAEDTLHPLDGIAPSDAQAVHDAARGLMSARDEGILPMLDPTLTAIQDPSSLLVIAQT